MKTRDSIARTSLLLLLFFATAISSCDWKQKDPVKVADDHNDAKFNGEDAKNSRAVVDVAGLLLEDIELAKLAQNNSIKKDVRRIGQQMELEYTQSYSLLKQIALKKMITVPAEVSSSNKKTNTDLSYDISDKFDDKYFELTNKDHNNAIGLLEKIKSSCRHEEIKTWADTTLSVYKKNLSALTALQQRLELTKPNTEL